MTGTDTTDAVGRAASAADPGGLMRAYEAASMYYVQGETMEVIAHHLRVSRSTVSRLLARARQEGVVRVTLVQPGGAGSLEGRMTQAFGVRTHIVPVREGTTEIHRLQQVASVAAAHMVDLIEALAEQAGNGGPQVQDPAGSGGEGPVQGRGSGGVVVGVAWGTTMSEVSAALPSRSVPGLTVVQLNGASDPVREGPSAGEVLSRMRLSLGARTISFPVPAFFDHVATREAMWSERSVKRVLAVTRRASLAVFGVGALDALNGALPSQVYEGGHLTARDQAVLRRQNVVGDVCTVLLRSDGSWRDVTLNARATGPTPAQLSRIPRRLCVAAGTGKARALLAALRARTATDLIVDDATARAVLELAEARGQAGGGSR
ncbi:transcriptional regulator [Actinomyces naeslundii]|uniref:Transcriptional regulator n=5 Tax=Actinomyces naeslundii TaxID=1655 RepID=A0A854EET3_ACTNA|nr:sugar-binding domain-containing protein [Actinomyces naeslundii]OMG20312.1 transcriptional regulator [Actinomyces naeslundii]OMG34987.1 transcriptional regulator [Actinomyces naeslundii]OMG41864.1 transcriptional regulator [Actinomyces naeslundii]QQC20856.1 helix-turn-helix domain-containing protein [Actinomyces naeslundii]